MSGILDSIPVYAVLAEDVGQRGAYRVGYQQFYHLLPDLAEVSKDVCNGQVNSAACQKRNKLLLITGVLTTLFILGAKGNHSKL